MDFARVLLLPVLLIAGLVDVASAQQSTWHVFPQFAFGGGWESTLMVQAGDTPTSCEFGVPGYQGTDKIRVEIHAKSRAS